MGFEVMRRILQGMDLPDKGFEDLLAELEKLDGRKAVARADREARGAPPRAAKLRPRRAA
jgi:hypothetical protein